MIRLLSQRASSGLTDLHIPEAKRCLRIDIPNYVTVSFHNFKTQIFKLSVSNPKSEYVDHLPVLSQISNCQSLGCKNKHETLKTDRISNYVNHLCLWSMYELFLPI